MERQAANNLRIHVLGKMFVDLTFTIVIPEFYSALSKLKNRLVIRYACSGKNCMGR